MVMVMVMVMEMIMKGIEGIVGDYNSDSIAIN